MSYRLNNAKDFVDVMMNIYENASKPAVWASRVAACLEENVHLWTIYPCTPSYLLSNLVVNRMYSTLRDIKRKCLGDFSANDVCGIKTNGSS